MTVKWPDGRITEDRASLYNLAAFIEGRSHQKGSELISFCLSNGSPLGLWASTTVNWSVVCATHAAFMLERIEKERKRK